MKLQLYNEQASDGSVGIYADNSEFYPISIQLNPETSHMDIDPTYSNPAVVPPRTEGYQIARLVGRAGKSWKFNYAFASFPGDVSTAHHDDSHIYQLPYATDQIFWISQGYQGVLSHQGENALDFDMPIGTPVHAARGGVVVDLVEHHDRSCSDESCNQFNNFLHILHDDGSFAAYAHLQKDGILVDLGEVVAAGDLIAYSGNTGWTTGPHLHFVVFITIVGRRETFQTQFDLRNGSSGLLREGSEY
ncbi:MAG: M23 family metallopeptidase [Saprospiraceae bacterium]|nr:M23 family metallopeptidase [Saprospiraceae bacterium]